MPLLVPVAEVVTRPVSKEIFVSNAHRGTPKNIVLLSDGTGNSSAKLMKTNVWRMYEAIDLTKGDQLALYDNGVGTSSFKPLAVLGGALGWGLKRNVRTLYTFVCANYRPGDRIFAFGFSRGAFTIRVLIGLIADQGLIAGVKGRELERQAKWAYRAYRRQFNPTKGLVTPLRAIRDWLLPKLERKPPYTKDGHVMAPVSFVGLWDTVDAYGLPIDEMTRGWDQWVWPLSMSDHTRPDNVEKICHAVALDDERHTFHPVLLDERAEPACDHTDKEKVTQVWFAGVHSNVGGGYPDDSLACVPLRWMAAEACKKHLRLHPHAENEWEARADPNGPLYDSRRGLGSYYRYNPRSIKKLTDDRFADVHVPRPKIHESVFHRIALGLGDYAPIVLPDDYAVVTGDGVLVGRDQNPFEHSTQSQSRCADQERVWNLVWWRRIAYFTTVGLTVLLFARPFIIDPSAGGILAVPSNGLSAAVGLLATFLPDVALPWVEFYKFRPVQLVLLGVFDRRPARVEHRAAAGDHRSDAGVVGRYLRAAGDRGHAEPRADGLGVSTALASVVSQLIRSDYPEGISVHLWRRVPGRACSGHRRHGEPRGVCGGERCGQHVPGPRSRTPSLEWPAENDPSTEPRAVPADRPAVAQGAALPRGNRVA